MNILSKNNGQVTVMQRAIKLGIKFHLTLLAIILIASHSMAETIPAVLPHPDKTPPAKDKPVKVYIMSGQSNMVGFGVVGGSNPTYKGIYLSADPNVLPCKMPLGSSAVLPHYVFQELSGDTKGAKTKIYKGEYDPNIDYSKETPIKEEIIPLGDVSKQLPTGEGPCTVIVKAFIEVPITGNHELHAGYGESSNAIITIDGNEVYRKEPGKKKEIKKIRLTKGTRHALTITFLKGGPAVFWLKLVGLHGKGNLTNLVRQGLFPFLKENGKWTVRNDVVLCESYLDKNKFKGGRNCKLSAKANGKFIGPELGFGYVMGTYHDEPVLLIKSCMGNRSLGWDILPKGCERYEFGGKVYAGYGDYSSSWEKGSGPKKSGAWYAGKQYDEFTKAIHGVLNNFDKIFPQYKDQGYEIAGFVWWQGHKDGGTPAYRANYGKNLASLIKAWRKEFKAPDAKWVIATVGFDGDKMNENYREIAKEQLSVSGESDRFPEFKGNVKTIDSRPYWRPMGESPTDKGYHYNHNAEAYYLTGDALGRAMVELCGKETEPSPTSPRPEPIPDKPVSELTLEEMANLIYTNPYLTKYAPKDNRVPTPKQMKEMGPAIRPMIVADIIPAYIAEAPKVPAYRRFGSSLMPLVELRHPKGKEYMGMTTQLDQIIGYYTAAGINDYNWNVVSPDMKNATWDYFTFDPPEEKDKKKSDRFRKVSLPEGMEKWYAVDFDTDAAKWKKGPAPFGQKGGKLAPQRPGCRNPHCGCGMPPKTPWDKEVLLMRRTFEVPEVKDDHRYRLIVGGSAHTFSGEGFEIYVNGKLFTRVKSGNMKKGGIRGGYFYSDFMPELKKGKITVAVKSFLRYTYHRDKPAPVSGHLDVWLESAKLPEKVLNLKNNIRE